MCWNGLLLISTRLRRPIHRVSSPTLDFCLLSPSFDVHSIAFSHSLWTSACFLTASTSILTRFLAPFGLPHAFHPLRRPIRRVSSHTLDFCLLPHSSDVHSDTFSCSFWTSNVPFLCFDVQLTL